MRAIDTCERCGQGAVECTEPLRLCNACARDFYGTLMDLVRTVREVERVAVSPAVVQAAIAAADKGAGRPV